jgi:hypothetical protein
MSSSRWNRKKPILATAGSSDAHSIPATARLGSSSRTGAQSIAPRTIPSTRYCSSTVIRTGAGDSARAGVSTGAGGTGDGASDARRDGGSGEAVGAADAIACPDGANEGWVVDGAHAAIVTTRIESARARRGTDVSPGSGGLALGSIT